MDDELKARSMRQNNNLFRMLIKIHHNDDANLATVSNLKRWHERLGHTNYKNIHQLWKEGLIDGSIKDNDASKDTFCEACQYGKQHRLSFGNAVKRKPMPGEFIHSDVCGPMSQDSIGGSRFFFQRRVKTLRVDNGREYCNE
ncbi:hypothetical protein DMN91_012043 [Ooceraea biroi]|uniref:GAG-pre-integrase domain-containing protein n=1 Tax=Ooceraea biroi TaxID=2015173 RepID=A0A3L8D869_OOCBI|nr:hypothetical protein DMN91_012043 [Ooceraea biroi]